MIGQKARQLGDRIYHKLEKVCPCSAEAKAWKKYWEQYDAEVERLTRKVPCAGCGRLLDPTSREDQLYVRKSVLDDGTVGLFCSNGCAIHKRGRIDICEADDEKS